MKLILFGEYIKISFKKYKKTLAILIKTIYNIFVFQKLIDI
jgi:hypothetical protein